MPEPKVRTAQSDYKAIAEAIIKDIEKERESEIIRRRFGLETPRQTLEQVGNLLNITRERVRQIEKQVIARLATGELDRVSRIDTELSAQLESIGNIAPLAELAERLGVEREADHAYITFLSSIAPSIVVINDNDHFYHSVALRQHHDEKDLHRLVSDLIKVIEELGRPSEMDEIAQRFDGGFSTKHVHGLARAAKRITSLDDKWGLTNWPLVNPKSIRDKIYVIFQREGKPLHFSDLARSIKESDFRRRDVTTQAIHNELIKDDRFVLVGRGIYALKEWGYKQGTVADVIADVLRGEPSLHRDEIVKRVLKQRHVKPTTIILNLQGKPQFKRVAKATYALAE